MIGSSRLRHSRALLAIDRPQPLRKWPMCCQNTVGMHGVHQNDGLRCGTCQNSLKPTKPSKIPDVTPKNIVYWSVANFSPRHYLFYHKTSTVLARGLRSVQTQVVVVKDGKEPSTSKESLADKHSLGVPIARKEFFWQKSKCHDPDAVATLPSVFDDPEAGKKYDTSPGRTDKPRSINMALSYYLGLNQELS